jgi:hypothetical protein
MIVDPVRLMAKYLDGKQPDLTHDEREILLFALYCESRKNDGLAAEAIRLMVRTLPPPRIVKLEPPAIASTAAPPSTDPTVPTEGEV